MSLLIAINIHTRHVIRLHSVTPPRFVSHFQTLLPTVDWKWWWFSVMIWLRAIGLFSSHSGTRLPGCVCLYKCVSPLVPDSNSHPTSLSLTLHHNPHQRLIHFISMYVSWPKAHYVLPKQTSECCSGNYAAHAGDSNDSHNHTNLSIYKLAENYWFENNTLACNKIMSAKQTNLKETKNTIKIYHFNSQTWVGEDIPQAIWLEMLVIRITRTDRNEIITTGRKLQITLHSDASNFHAMIWSSVGFTTQTMSYVSAPAKPKSLFFFLLQTLKKQKKKHLCTI